MRRQRLTGKLPRSGRERMRELAAEAGVTIKEGPRIDVSDLTRQLCERLELEPSTVARIDLKPDVAVVTVYRLNEGGAKYIELHGDAATETIVYAVKA